MTATNSWRSTKTFPISKSLSAERRNTAPHSRFTPQQTKLSHDAGIKIHVISYSGIFCTYVHLECTYASFQSASSVHSWINTPTIADNYTWPNPAHAIKNIFFILILPISKCVYPNVLSTLIQQNYLIYKYVYTYIIYTKCGIQEQNLLVSILSHNISM